jgi:hypothetical protein
VNRLTASLLRIATDAGPQDILAVIPPDGVLDQGIADHAILGAFEKLVDAGGPLPYERFAQNPAFLRVLHGVIREHAPSSPDLRQEAERLGDGWLYVIDRRTATPADRVPPEDIVGVFSVRGGAVVPASYTPSPNYRLFTADGLFQLDEHLGPFLLKALGQG